LFPEQIVEDDGNNENSFASHWGWYQAISSLSENKIWLFNDVTDLPLVQCLNHLSYLMDFNKEKERIMKESYN
jgi:hypothetical protein